MPIWKRITSLESLTAAQRGTLSAHIGLCYTEIGDDYIRGTLPVDSRTVQPYRRLHGGALVALAEELGSVAANLCLAPGLIAFGLDINANHIRGTHGGIVTGTARPLHIGRTTQIWEIRIENERGQLVGISRLTMAVLAAPPGETASQP